MWTRSAADKKTGLMTVVCTDWNGAEFFKGEFATLAEAETAGQDAERRMTFAMSAPAAPTLEQLFSEMDDADLLAELLG